MTSLIAALSLVTLTIYPSFTLKSGKVRELECTAVYIGPTTAMTAAHCVSEDIKTIKALPYTGGEYTATIIDCNVTMGLALLHINAPSHAYAKLGKVAPQIGERVYTINSGEYMPGTYNEGIVNNVVFDSNLHSPFLLHSAFIYQGASGGGLFNAAGELIGINVIQWQSLSEAVTPETISYFLYCATLRNPGVSILKTRANFPIWNEALLAPFLLEFQLPQAVAHNLLPQ